MRLPHSLLHSLCFCLDTPDELIRCLRGYISDGEQEEIHRLSKYGLPPVTSENALAVMFGFNPGFIWSILNNSHIHYNPFILRSAGKDRIINAPRLSLKIIQKWLAVNLDHCYKPLPHVFGFIPGRSHLQAAAKHVGARWVYSVDIKDFFPSTTQQQVLLLLRDAGYSQQSASIISAIVCFRGVLPQGSPASPLLSNLAFKDNDIALEKYATERRLTLSRYADDIVFSSREEFPDSLPLFIEELFRPGPWKLSVDKIKLQALPKRIKVHGLLVSGKELRLTKGYRNKVRAYEHILKTKKLDDLDSARLLGHVNYARSVKVLERN